MRNLEQDHSSRLFRAAADADRGSTLDADYLERWLLADEQKSKGQRTEMSFEQYLGPDHVRHYFHYINPFRYPDWFGGRLKGLTQASLERDRAVLERLGLEAVGPNGNVLDLENIARYNAQDYRLMRFYPMPRRMQVETVLDFGAGHGRQANLLFREGADPVRLIAIDAIEASYLTQRAYYTGLGLDLAEYVEARDAGEDFDVASLLDSHDVVHLPTWRFDLVPDDSVDLLCTVQVLKELPRELVPWAIGHFARVVHPGGALYVRDHPQDHRPNQMPVEELLAAAGFVLEFAPQVADRRDIHGVPRIYRRLDPGLLYRPPTPWKRG
ncbi:MAG: hypothetical protein CMH83_13700 [Nocardioides sp.]|nr:hypothetical protein [Nocardioides sp.]